MKQYRKPLNPGDIVQVLFQVDPPVENCSGERMWVILTNVSSDGTFRGTLDNDPVIRTDLHCGQVVTFDIGDVIQAK